MDLEHDPRRVLDAHRKEALEHQHDELHRRIVVVEHQHLVVGRLLGSRASARRDSGLDLVEAVVAVVGARRHHCPTHADRTHRFLKYGKVRNARKTAVQRPAQKNGGRSLGSDRHGPLP